jgi:periplasmic mercuric ion binding protein
MKKMIFLLSAIVSMNLMAGEKLEVSVKGMVCSFCSQGIEKKFKEQNVKSVDVSLEKHLVTMELNDGQTIDDKQIENLLKDAGYAVEKIVRK